jgi:hypothetical protein
MSHSARERWSRLLSLRQRELPKLSPRLLSLLRSAHIRDIPNRNLLTSCLNFEAVVLCLGTRSKARRFPGMPQSDHLLGLDDPATFIAASRPQWSIFRIRETGSFQYVLK